MKTFRIVLANVVLAVWSAIALLGIIGYLAGIIATFTQGNAVDAIWCTVGCCGSVLCLALGLTVLVLVNETPEERQQRKELNMLDETLSSKPPSGPDDVPYSWDVPPSGGPD